MVTKMSRICLKCGTSDRYSNGRCKKCRLGASSRWKKANPKKIRTSNARWAKNNPNKVNARKINWRSINAEKNRCIRANWAKNNPDKAIVYINNRRALKSGNGGRHTSEQWLTLLDSYHGLCVYCFNKATTRDHVIPLSKGGTNNIENVVPACRPCNDSKGKKSLFVWLLQRKVDDRRTKAA